MELGSKTVFKFTHNAGLFVVPVWETSRPWNYN